MFSTFKKYKKSQISSFSKDALIITDKSEENLYSQKLFKNVVLPFKSLPKQLFGKFNFIFTFSKYFPEML